MCKGRSFPGGVCDDFQHYKAVHSMTHGSSTAVKHVLIPNAIQRLMVPQLTVIGHCFITMSHLYGQPLYHIITIVVHSFLQVKMKDKKSGVT